MPDVDINGTGLYAPAAAHTGRTAAVFVLVIFQFVHEPLANTLCFHVPGVVAGAVQGEKREHARVPKSQTIAFVSTDFVLNVKTPAGWADKSTGPAVDAGKLDLFPDGRIIKLEHVLLSDRSRIESLAHSSFC